MSSGQTIEKKLQSKIKLEFILHLIIKNYEQKNYNDNES